MQQQNPSAGAHGSQLYRQPKPELIKSLTYIIMVVREKGISAWPSEHVSELDNVAEVSFRASNKEAENRLKDLH
jgi:hypothetical protein